MIAIHFLISKHPYSSDQFKFLIRVSQASPSLRLVLVAFLIDYFDQKFIQLFSFNQCLEIRVIGFTTAIINWFRVRIVVMRKES